MSRKSQRGGVGGVGGKQRVAVYCNVYAKQTFGNTFPCNIVAYFYVCFP